MSEKQFIEVSYGPVELVANSQIGSAKRRPRFHERVIGALSFLRNLLVSVTVIGALLTLTILTILELRRNPIIIEPVSLPPSLTDRGFSGTVTAHRLWDAINEIQEKSQTIKAPALLTTDSRQLDIVEPSSGISLQELTQMLRAVLNRPQTRISGEVICESASCSWPGMRLRLRIFTNGRLIVRDIGLIGGRGSRDYFHQAATQILYVTDPYSLAAYYFNIPGYRERAVKISEELISTHHAQRAWAAVLIGNHYGEIESANAAVRWYERSIALAKEDELSGFSLPLINLGNVFANDSQPERAIIKYEQAIEIDPRVAAAWNSWGNILYRLGEEEEAIEKYERAIQLDLTAAEPRNGLASSQARLGNLDDAVENYRIATEFDQDYAPPWHGWGDVLSELGRHEQAIEKYSRALVVDPGYSRAARGWARALQELQENTPEFTCARMLEYGESFTRVAAPLLPDNYFRTKRIIANAESCAMKSR